MLELHKLGEGPTVFAVHPWRRAAGSPTVGARTPIDGDYRVTTTQRELEAVAPGETPLENYGDLTWRFDRGRFVFTQRNGPAHERSTGTYAVAGDRVVIRLEHVTGVHPSGAAARAGERWEYRWSRYRDRLELHAIPGAVSPEPLRVKPWRRVE